MKDKIARLKKRAGQFPKLPGVYLMKRGQDQILYAGKAKSLKARVSSYFSQKAPGLKTEFLIRQTEELDYIVTKSETEAFLLEASLIKKLRPRCNVRLKDDKAYPYIRFSAKDDFPRFYMERRVKDSRSLYFGPYTEAWAVRAILDFLNQSFQIRDCADSDFKSRRRPCLSWDMGLCSAPCVGKTGKSEYQKSCKKALGFLEGKSQGLAGELKARIKSRAKALRFEEAGRLRDSLMAFERIEQSQQAVQKTEKDKDAAAMKRGKAGLLIDIAHFRKGRLIGNRFYFFKESLIGDNEEEFALSFLNQYYSENLIPDELLIKLPIKTANLKLLEKALKSRKGAACRIRRAFNSQDTGLIYVAEKNAESHFKSELSRDRGLQGILTEIKTLFHLPKLPRRMECYDISHWSGGHSVGSQAVFEEAQPAKKEYRIYNLKSESKGDDYLALREVLSRRLKRKEREEPDLILIDGGRGQLSAAQQILKALNREDIPLASLAKDKIKNKGAYKEEAVSSGERLYLPGRKNPVAFPPRSKALSALLWLRDEAHRLAVQSHRRRRDKMFLKAGQKKSPKKR